MLHLGDIKSGRDRCDDAIYLRRKPWIPHVGWVEVTVDPARDEMFSFELRR